MRRLLKTPRVFSGLLALGLSLGSALARAEEAPPAASPNYVVVRRDVHEQIQKILFATNRAVATVDSLPVIDKVAQTLKAHPELLRLRIEGHADTDERQPVELSQRRADWVKKALIDRGIAAKRLEVHAYGRERPLIPRTETLREPNRRVEFNIVERQ